MKKFLLFTLSLIIISCNSKNQNENTSFIDPVILEEKPVIIIDHQEEQTLYIRKLASITYPKLPIYSFEKGNDTIRLENKTEVIKISSPENYTQEVLLETNDTLRISFQNNTISLAGNYMLMDSLEVKNKEVDRLHEKIAKTRERYFTLSEFEMTSFDIRNNYEKILMSAKGGGYYNKGLILQEPDSIVQLASYYSKLKQIKIKEVQSSKKYNSRNNTTKKLLIDKAINDYYSQISSLLEHTKKETAIQILKNSLNENSLDGNSRTTYSHNLLDDSVLENEYAASNFHIVLNVLQQEYSYKTKTKRKSRFYDLYFHLPSYFDNELLRVAKSMSIDKMMSWNEPWIEIEKCYQDYISIYGSDQYIRDFEEQNQNKLGLEIKDNKSLLLANVSNTSTDLKKLIEQFKGKPIYIDYWASWCAPCIQNMPFSRKLKDKLGDKIVFLFISIDTDEAKWKSASQNLKLLKNKSFITLNYEKSEFINRYNVTAIPRYMIYDKAGKLYNDNAPAPHDDLLYEKLIKLTK